MHLQPAIGQLSSTHGQLCPPRPELLHPKPTISSAGIIAGSASFLEFIKDFPYIIGMDWKKNNNSNKYSVIYEISK